MKKKIPKSWISNVFYIKCLICLLLLTVTIVLYNGALYQLKSLSFYGKYFAVHSVKVPDITPSEQSISFIQNNYSNESIISTLLHTVTTALTTSESVTTSKTINNNICPEKPPNLLGRSTVRQDEPTWEEVVSEASPKDNPVIAGQWKPKHCISRDRVAILIPYRNRERHLKILTRHLHPFLQRQELDYGIFVIDQLPGTRFNRAFLFNIGFLEAMKLQNFSCIIVHDVDLLPEDDNNLYRCTQHPKHLSVAVDKFKYALPYQTIFGGACAIATSQFRLVNGFSNLYFGWGGEDDDMYERIRRKKLTISRYPSAIARYSMISHKIDHGNEINPKRFKLLKNSASRMNEDGLSSISYTVKMQGAGFHNMVYLIQVEIPEQEFLKQIKV